MKRTHMIVVGLVTLITLVAAPAAHAQSPKPTLPPAAVAPPVTTQVADTKAAAEKPAPELSEVSKLQIQNLAKDMQIAQLTAQQAQATFDRAQQALQQLLASLQIEGYDLDQTLAYKPKPPAPAPPIKK